MCLTLALYIIVKTELGLKILCLILLNLNDKNNYLKINSKNGRLTQTGKYFAQFIVANI